MWPDSSSLSTVSRAGSGPGQHREQVQAAVQRRIHGREIETSRPHETCGAQQRAAIARRTVEDLHVAVHETLTLQGLAYAGPGETLAVARHHAQRDDAPLRLDLRGGLWRG